MNINQAIALNLSADGIPPRLHMVQGDSGTRTIVATLWNGAQPYTIPDEATLMLRFCKPDGTGGLYDTTEAGAAITFSGSAATIPVAAQVLAVAGPVYAQLDIYGDKSAAKAQQLATFRCIIDVAASVYPDAAIISSDYYNVLASKFAEAAAAAASASSSAEAAATSAEAATSAAIHTPRVGSNGNWETWDYAKGKYVSTGYPAIGSPAAFDVDASGKLRLYYTGDTAPDYSINEEGHLILQLDEDTSVDLGLVRGPKGDDYTLTAEDKQDIAALVLAALPDGDEVAYG